MARNIPLILTLFLTFAFAVTGLGLFIDAFVKANDEKDYLNEIVPTGTTVKVDDGDILTTGKVSIAIHALLILLSLLTLAALSITRFSSPKTFLLLAALLGFSAIWLLATTIAFTVIFATKAAKISASLGGVPLPQAIIEAQEKAFGLTPVYKHKLYLRVATIIPWFTFLFAAISSALLFLNSRKTSGHAGSERDLAESHDGSKNERSPI